MSDIQLLAHVHRTIEAAYVVPESPRYDFVQRALRNCPHGVLVQALVRAGFSVSDTTDANDDVAWHLALLRTGDEVDVAISMAGPFARVAPPVHAAEPEDLRRELETLLEAHGLIVVPERLMQERTSLVTSEGTATIAQALFANTQEG